jgi:hypothetical protein
MEKYTTAKLVAADHTGIEAKKTIISEDAYALCDFMEILANVIGREVK